MTVNERIKKVRKENGMNQKQFAALLGVTQSGVSYMEQSGSNVSDSSIKSICTICNINEDWLRNGTEPMYIQSPSFSLDKFMKSKGATDLEIEIVKTYFELDPEIRKAAVNHFKHKLSTAIATEPALVAPDTEEELEARFPPVDGDSDSKVG